MRPSSMPSTTAADSSRSPRNFGITTPREAARIDEHDGRAVLSDQLDESRIDRRPDAVLALRAVFILSGQPGHVFDRHLDGDLHRLQPPCVHDRDLAVCAAEKTAHLLQRALRGGRADALRLTLAE